MHAEVGEHAGPVPAAKPVVTLPWWVKWTRNALIAGLVVSLGAHLVMGMLATMIYFAGPAGNGVPGDGGNGSGGVEMALMTEGELSAIAGAGESDLAASPLASPGLTDTLNVEEKRGGPPGAAGGGGDAGADVGGGLGGGGDVTGGAGLGGGPGGAGGGTGTSFFGVEAKGERIAFVVDTSGSMNGDRLIELKSQLKAAINEMTETSSFLVVTFATVADALGGKVEWSDATTKNKQWAGNLIDGLNADGGTEPIFGFEVLFRVRPRADVVFFMTDGAFDTDGKSKVNEFLLKNNRGPRVKIHCICFEENSSEDRMKQIAKDSGGTYTFVRKSR